MIVDTTGSFDLVFWTAAVISLLGAVFYHYFVRKPIIRPEELGLAPSPAADESEKAQVDA
ncbi:hypothetical protein [Microbacterium sp. PRC9]|uniref:hypothetical protein n=1 Tax=Microbacterium sp. PRC9 TaxID=2962591 RepID=UPI002882413D|nr:hypothetical protein [Microbacterium sp. PRC9]MDT0144542.1 hypothetical protein [Microbacterium sp. PRC9]